MAAEGKISTLKLELREANQELNNLVSTFNKLNNAKLLNDDDIKKSQAEIAAATNKVKELNDVVEQTNNQISKLTSDSKFELVGKGLGDVASKLGSLDFDGASKSAANLAAISKSITFKDAVGGIEQIGTTVANVGKALLTNPLFLIAGAIALAVTYGKELFALADGISKKDRERLDTLKKQAAEATKQREQLDLQENALRLAGKSELEILKLKKQAGEEELKKQVAALKYQQVLLITQIEAEKRNKAILEGVIKFLTVPLQYLLSAVDLLTSSLNKAGLISDEVFAGIGNLQGKLNDKITSYFIDPKKTEEDGKKTIQAMQDTIAQLESDIKGYQVSINETNKKERDDAYTFARQTAQLRIDAMNDGREKERAQAKLNYENQVKEAEGNADRLAAVEDLYVKTKTDIDNKYTLQAKQNAIELEDIRIQTLEDGLDKEIASLNNKLAKELLEVGLTEEKKKALIAANEKALVDLKEKYANEQKARELKIAQEIANLKVQGMKDGLAKEIAAINIKEAEELAVVGRTEAEKEAIRKYYESLRAKATGEQKKKDEEEADEKIRAIVDVVNSYNQAFASINDIFSTIANARLDEIQRQADAEVAAIDEKERKILSNKNLTEEERKKIEAKYANERYEIERQAVIRRNALAEKEFKRNKAFQLTNAIVAGAAGVVGALGEQPFTPANFATATAVGIAAAANIAKIAATKFTPESLPQVPDLSGGISNSSAAGGNQEGATPNVGFFGQPNQLNNLSAATGLQNQNGQPNFTVTAVVSETEITNTQNYINRVRQSATL